MKAIQNFVVRSKALLMREQNRQIEIVKQKMQNQHSAHPTAPNQNSASKVFSLRQRTLLRPFSNILSATVINQAVRYTLIYKPMFQSAFSMGEMFRLDINSTENNTRSVSLVNSGILVSAEQNYFEGIMDIFNEPPLGKKQFCGRTIDVNFYHVLEFISPYNLLRQSDDCASELAVSEYINDELAVNNRLQRAARDPDNISLVQSEIQRSQNGEDQMSSYSDDESPPNLE